jgi:hypothetical protein
VSVRNGFVTAEDAARDYRMAVDPDSFAIDTETIARPRASAVAP